MCKLQSVEPFVQGSCKWICPELNVENRGKMWEALPDFCFILVLQPRFSRCMPWHFSLELWCVAESKKECIECILVAHASHGCSMKAGVRTFQNSSDKPDRHTAICHTMLVVLGAVHVASSYSCAKLYGVVRVVVHSCTAQGSRLLHNVGGRDSLWFQCA